MISSPVSNEGAFHDTWAAGDGDTQLMGHAASWEANPAISEATTIELEPDERVRRREYGAVPSSGVTSAFDGDDVERSFSPRDLAGAAYGRPVVLFDWSSGGKDATTWGRATRVRLASGRQIFALDLVDAMGGAQLRRATADQQADAIAALAKKVGAKRVIGDQREAHTLRSIFPARGVQFLEHPWNNANKRAAVELARRWMRDGDLFLVAHPMLRKQLHAFREIITASKSVQYRAKGGGHDDYASLVLLLAAAEIEGLLPRVIVDDGYGALAGRSPVTTYTSAFEGWGDPSPASAPFTLPSGRSMAEDVVREMGRFAPGAPSIGSPAPSPSPSSTSTLGAAAQALAALASAPMPGRGDGF